MNTHNSSRQHIAISSIDGNKIGSPLEESDHFLIFDISGSNPMLLDMRSISPKLVGNTRLETTCNLLKDCKILIAGSINQTAKTFLRDQGILVRTVKGNMPDILSNLEIIIAGESDIPFIMNNFCGNNNDSNCCKGENENYNGGCGCMNG